MFIIFNLFCRSVESDEFLIVGPTGYEQRHFKTPSWSFLGVSSTRNAECNQTKMMRIQFCACVIWFIWCISSSFVLGIFFVFPSWKKSRNCRAFCNAPHHVQDILDLMGDRLLDNSSRGAFDGSFKVTGDNKGNSVLADMATEKSDFRHGDVNFL